MLLTQRKGIEMEDNIILQRFLKFKSMMISSDMPNDMLMDLLESYMTLEDKDEPIVEDIPVLDGQMTLLEIAA